MKQLKTFCMLVMMCFAMGAFAQDTGSSKSAAPAAKPAPPAPTVSGAIDSQIKIIEREFVSAAEAMPEDKYNFTPAGLNIQGSDYKGVRTFAEEVKHVATANYMFWGAITGDPMPAGTTGPNGPDNIKTKADIVKYLKDSYAIGHKAANMLTAENAVTTVSIPMMSPNPIPKLFIATFAVAHGFDHYGQAVEYLRMNGIVPPASRGGN
ncbi:MAG TPA: DinB family protein [Candidatus Angelobacter sp.]|nr:DinB family protein [Candidatus Angelobacter sp.]